MIKETTIKDFQAVIKSEYNTHLSTDEARSVLENWVAYFDLLARINHRRNTEAK